jgi:Dullard-like phosphatase family protein
LLTPRDLFSNAEEELNSSLADTAKTCSSSFNASPAKEHNSQFVNFEDIDNFDIFQDFEPKIQNLSINSKNNENSHKSEKNQYCTCEFPCEDLFPLKKISIEKFESSLYELNFVESIENRPGNYHKYLKKVITSLKDFDRIDFTPQIEKRAVFLPANEKKITLVIDLDETLIHSDFDNEFDEGFHETLQFTHENETIQFNLFIRPGLHEFLRFAKNHFEVVIFTASRKEYADCILDYLDPEHNIISHRLYRDDCISIKNKIFIKDLRIFKNRCLSNMILIDNSFYSFVNQLNNGILITSFYDNEFDSELVNLRKYLQNVVKSDVDDVREVNEKIFNFEGIWQQILDC